MIAAPEAFMLGSSAASATCCMAPATRATGRARALSGVMVAVMIAGAVFHAVWVGYLGALVLLVMAVGLLAEVPPKRGRETAWHRASGAGLMASALLLHHHVHGGMQMSGPYEAGMRTDISAMASTGPAHDHVTQFVLQAAVVVYLVWTVATVLRMRHLAWSHPLRWEHAAMATSLGFMVLGMT